MSSRSLPVTNIILDNLRSDAFSYQGSWGTLKVDQWFNGTVSSSNATSAAVTMTFNGTSVALLGTTPSSSQSQSFSVSIDNNTAVNTSFSDPNPSSYRQWYQSPTLSDGLHTITLSNLTGSSIDFALVTVGPQTPLGGEIIVVDDSDSGISFSSGWRTDKDKFNVGGSAPISGFTLGNSTHDTNTVGSSFTYKFSGSAIAIYGLFDFSSSSLLLLSFSIDSQSLSQKYLVTTSSPQLVNEIGQEPNYLFYSYDFLNSGEHTLVVNVTECMNSTFRFDYLTYVPTFGKLSDMPTDLGGSGSNPSPGTGSGGHREVSIIGVAVGVVIGAVVLGVLLFLLLRRGARRRRNESSGKYSSAPIYSAVLTSGNSPLLPTSSHTNTTTPTPFSLSSHSQQNPSTGSTLGPMALRQNESAAQYGLSFPHANDTHPISNAGLPAGAAPPLRTWEAHRTNETNEPTVSVNVDPPSYEEVTSAHT